jgi:ribosomal protein S18 acetylase RimI-like enzyme
MPREAPQYSVRCIKPDDFSNMRIFLNSSIYLHQHLDWHTPNERLNFSPFWIAERNATILGAFCSPILNHQISWIQLFAIKKMISQTRAWQSLWDTYTAYCQETEGSIQVFSLAYYPWYLNLLKSSGFEPSYAIVTLENEALYLPDLRLKTSHYALQPITIESFLLVHKLDTLAFDLPWQMTEAALQKAFQSSIYATMIKMQDQIIGYQITTEGENTLHLARIAVHPAYQNQGIAGYLIHDLVLFMKRFHYRNLSVNTQSNNHASLALYRKMGFYKTGSSIPVMVYMI